MGGDTPESRAILATPLTCLLQVLLISISAIDKPLSEGTTWRARHQPAVALACQVPFRVAPSRQGVCISRGGKEVAFGTLRRRGTLKTSEPHPPSDPRLPQQARGRRPLASATPPCGRRRGEIWLLQQKK